MTKRKLNRRIFLTGIGGTMIGIPLLETMLTDNGDAFAADGSEIPQRYIVAFGGHSMGADNDPIHNMFAPQATGRGYDTPLALEPLAELELTDHVSIVTDLEIPSANGGSSPSGGRHDDFHIASLSPLLSGVRSVTGGRPVRGITSDQVVAQAIGQGNTFKSLVYRVQASWYLDQSAPYGRDLISYRGENDAIEATVSPRQAFNSLFSNFAPPDPVDADRRNFMLRSRKSVLDLVRGSYERLVPQLSAADRIRLEQHLSEIRELELRVNAIAPLEGGICMLPDDPGADPPVGGNNPSSGGSDFDNSTGYSNENDRARIFSDMIHMAMACDLTRVASLQYTMAQSHMNMYPLIQIPYDLHEIGHASSRRTEGVSQGIKWHVGHWAYLVKKFQDTPEPNGTMLDNAAILYLNEGGHGYDPGGQKDNSTHSTERMVMMIAGRAGGLKSGQHVITNKAHPANVLISGMKAVGVQGDTLGEVTGVVSELFEG